MSVFIQAQWATAVAGQMYANAGSTAQILDKFTAYNSDVSPQTLTVYLVPSGGALDASLVAFVVSISAGQSYLCGELVGHDLDPGDSIWCLAGVADKISIRCSGRTR